MITFPGSVLVNRPGITPVVPMAGATPVVPSGFSIGSIALAGRHHRPSAGLSDVHSRLLHDRLLAGPPDQTAEAEQAEQRQDGNGPTGVGLVGLNPSHAFIDSGAARSERRVEEFGHLEAKRHRGGELVAMSTQPIGQSGGREVVAAHHAPDVPEHERRAQPKELTPPTILECPRSSTGCRPCPRGSARRDSKETLRSGSSCRSRLLPRTRFAQSSLSGSGSAAVRDARSVSSFMKP